MINETFAGVVLRNDSGANIDPTRQREQVAPSPSVPWARPAILVGTVLDELERTGKSTALVTMCIGGGQGIATILERV